MKRVVLFLWVLSEGSGRPRRRAREPRISLGAMCVLARARHGPNRWPAGGAVQAHVILASKMKERDPNTAPVLGDRVPYVIVKVFATMPPSPPSSHHPTSFPSSVSYSLPRAPQQSAPLPVPPFVWPFAMAVTATPRGPSRPGTSPPRLGAAPRKGSSRAPPSRPPLARMRCVCYTPELTPCVN